MEESIFNVQVAEAKAICLVSGWALQRGWLSIVVESDDQGVVLSLVDHCAFSLVH